MDTSHFPSPFFLELVEKAIAKALRFDPRTRAGMAAMAGKVIAVELLGVGATLYALPHEQGVRLLHTHEGEAHVRIRGAPFALLAMAKKGRERRPSTFSGEVEFIGDLALGQHIQSVMASLDLEWEELLSTYIGDIAAHKLGNLCRGVTTWFKRTHQILEQDAGEYLRTEARVLLEPDDAKSFVSAVDTLRMDADRLEARLLRLQRQVLGAR
jgi:ubiquinone biosynthesis protein UbiJ